MAPVYTEIHLNVNEKKCVCRSPLVTGGDRASVVLSEPLNGGSPEVRVTGPEGRKSDLKAIQSLELTLQRCRPAFAEAACPPKA